MDKYIEISSLNDPAKVFEKLENEFIDIMYPAYVSEKGLVMLLDVNIDPGKKEDLDWLKRLLNTVLPEMGETKYSVAEFTPCAP